MQLHRRHLRRGHGERQRLGHRSVATVAVATADATAATTGQTVHLDGSGSFASNGRSITDYNWGFLSGSGDPPAIANADLPNASFVAKSNDVVMLRLTVTDGQGAQDFTDVVVGVTVAVSPQTASVAARGGTQAFAATGANTSNTVVTWQVNGVTGGNSTVAPFQRRACTPHRPRCPRPRP
jgi:hypothetical protein